MYTHPAKMFPGGSVMGQSTGDNPAMELNEVVQYGWNGELEWSFFDWDEVNGVKSARVQHGFQRDGKPVGYSYFVRFSSRIPEFDPVTLDLVWKYEAPNFFSFHISGMQRLPNGNTLIDEGSVGRIFEVTPAGEKVWEYVEGAGMQFLGKAYRAYRVPPEWVPGNPAGYTPGASCTRRLSRPRRRRRTAAASRRCIFPRSRSGGAGT